MVRVLTGTTQRAIIETLTVHESLTVAELARLIGRSHDATHSSLLALRDQRAANICSWITTPGKGRESAVWRLGQGDDAPRPVFTRRYRRAQKNASQRRNYYRKKLHQVGPSPWAGLLVTIKRNAT